MITVNSSKMRNAIKLKFLYIRNKEIFTGVILQFFNQCFHYALDVSLSDCIILYKKLDIYK